MRDTLKSALSIYAVDDAMLRALAPDVIVTQDLCEVCAVSLDDLRTAVARLANRDDVRIVSPRPTRSARVISLEWIDPLSSVLSAPSSRCSRNLRASTSPTNDIARLA